MISQDTLAGLFDELEKIALTFQDLSAQHHLPAPANTVPMNLMPKPKQVIRPTGAVRKNMAMMSTQMVSPIGKALKTVARVI